MFEQVLNDVTPEYEDRINIYKVNIEIASCGVSDGLYIGMAHIKKINGVNKLTINATSKNFSIFLNLK